MLFEVHQPIGHLQVRHVEQRAICLERCRIFAVRIDHDDVALRRELAYFMKDQRGTRRFAGTGRSEQGKMLAEHCIDKQGSPDILGGINIADLDMRAVISGIHLFHVGRGYRESLRAGRRITRNAAAEIIDFAGQPFFIAFAEEIDKPDRGAIAIAVRAQRPEVGHQPGRAHLDLDLAANLPAHRKAGVGCVGKRRHGLQVEPHLRRRS